MRFRTVQNLFFAVFVLSGLVLLNRGRAAAKGDLQGSGNNSYYDSTILGTETAATKGSKKKNKKHHHRSKTLQKNRPDGNNPSPGEAQEDVTDQKEVSEQADQPNSKHKK
jgi:hypothetical protein